MTVVQINAVYGKGSTGEITMELHRHLLAKGHDSYVLWSAVAAHTNDQNVYRIGNPIGAKMHAVLTRMFGTQCFHSFFSTKRTIRLLHKIRPDVVHLHNLHSNFMHLPMLLRYLAKEKIPVVITLHDCWFFTGGCFHPTLRRCDAYKRGCKGCPEMHLAPKRAIRSYLFRKKKELFSALSSVAVVGVSGWASDSAHASSMFGEKTRHTYIYNWIDSDVFHPTEDADAVRARYGLVSDDRIILGVAQNWKRDKGIEFFLSLSTRVDAHTKILLVGLAPNMKGNEALRFVGRTDNAAELASLYSLANVFVNPSPAETFGKVTAEALACGTPVIAYNNTGTAELVPESCGVLIQDGDTDAMTEAVLEMIAKDVKTGVEERCAFAKENFSITSQIEKYVALYKDLAKK